MHWQEFETKIRELYLKRYSAVTKEYLCVGFDIFHKYNEDEPIIFEVIAGILGVAFEYLLRTNIISLSFMNYIDSKVETIMHQMRVRKSDFSKYYQLYESFSADFIKYDELIPRIMNVSELESLRKYKNIIDKIRKYRNFGVHSIVPEKYYNLDDDYIKYIAFWILEIIKDVNCIKYNLTEKDKYFYEKWKIFFLGKPKTEMHQTVDKVLGVSHG